MGGRYSSMDSARNRDELDEIKTANPIADILAERGHYPVGVAGTRLTYRSPLRDETSPSFSVDPDKAPGGLYYDFGSGKGGDVITLIQELDELSIQDAIAYLRQRRPR